MAQWFEEPGSHLILPDTIEEVAATIGRTDYNYIFLVYGATEQLETNYVSSQRREEIRQSYPLSLLPIAHITPGDTGVRGVVFSMTNHPSRFSGEELEEILRTVRTFADALGAGPIGLGGQIPSILNLRRLRRDHSYVMGAFGSVHTVMATVEAVREIEGIAPENLTVGVNGVGFLGRRVSRYMRDLGYQVVGYEPAATRDIQGIGMLLTGNREALTQCGIVLNLAPQGDDLGGILPYLQEGVVVIDDTHPRPSDSTIRAVLQKGRLYWAGMKKTGVLITPSFPGRHEEEIPGCALETILRAMGSSIPSQSVLNTLAQDHNFDVFPQRA